MWAEIADEVGTIEPDVYGTGGVVGELEAEVSAILGKPEAVFMASVTMAQQIALRIHADRTDRDMVLAHPTSHVILHEDQAAERLHRLHVRPVGSADQLMTTDDLATVAEYAAALLIELPQREIGGQLSSGENSRAR